MLVRLILLVCLERRTIGVRDGGKVVLRGGILLVPRFEKGLEEREATSRSLLQIA